MISPNSIFKSRALMLALVISATMAVFGSMLFMTAFFGTCNINNDVVIADAHYVETVTECDALLNRANAMENNELVWLQAVNCFDVNKNSEGVIRSAAQAIKHFPKTESFYNIKGYHEIETKRYRAAVRTLSKGLRNVETPSSGTMENNLAWAGLWINMDTNDMRRLYTNALTFDTTDCEIVHTGLWVEYAIASEKGGHLKSEAIGKYRDLRRRYDGCETRSNNSGEKFGYEVIGAGVLDHAMATIIATEQLERGHIDVRAFSRSGIQTVRVGMGHLPNRALNSDDDICSESSPLSRLRSKCRTLLDSVR